MTDIILTTIIFAVAVWFLYRHFFVNKGCSGCGGSCDSKKNLPTVKGCDCGCTTECREKKEQA